MTGHVACRGPVVFAGKLERQYFFNRMLMATAKGRASVNNDLNFCSDTDYYVFGVEFGLLLTSYRFSILVSK